VDPHVEQWIQLVVRWAHVITGIAWIGTSFYFNWLNSRIHPPAAPEPGVGGELWSVHGGGFYRVVKYSVAPARLPDTLHWFRWEAYATWWTGFTLLWLIYYVGARTHLVDPGVARIPILAAVGIGLATLAGVWLAYDLLCRSALGRRPAALGAALAAMVVGLAFGLTQAFTARGAFLHVGAALGTVMAANVWRVIIPAQRAMVAALASGREPDAARGAQAALRSLHNNYFTLPVVFTMIGGHVPATYGHPWSWAVLAGLFLAGVATRHWFNLRNQGRRNRWLLPAAGLVIVVLAVVTAPTSAPSAAASDGTPPLFAAARVVIAERCAPCHSAAPTQSGIAVAPAGAVFDTPEQMRAWAPRIRERAVTARTMPLGNVTGMTEDERALLGRWIAAGAVLR
jgi:uncharacterized membrane protein